MHKNFLLLILSVATLSACTSEKDTDSDRQPNILVIVADDLGWNDVSFHGSDIKTPNLDRLASQGTELTRFYTAPVCSPTRAGLMSGRYPDRINLRNHVYSPKHTSGLPPETETLPELLKDAGYKRTAAFGKWHLGHSNIKYHPNSQGFDEFYGHYNGAIDYFTHKRDAELDWHRNNEPNFDEGYSTDLVEKDVIRFLNESDGNEPFLAYVAFNAPHSPMQAKEEDLKMYGYDPNLPQEDYDIGGSQRNEREMDIYGMQGRGNTLRQTFSGMVTALDRSIGNILKTLDDKNLTDETIVWFLSDNGGVPRFGGNNVPLRGAKHTEWEGGVRVVSIMRWPGKIEPDTKNDQMIAYIDIIPTLLGIAGGNYPDDLDGIDVWDAIKGNPLPERYIFLGNTGIVSKEWKMNQGELFRIEEDMEEKNNVADQHPEVVSKLEALLVEFHKMRPDAPVEMQPEGWNPPENWTMPE
jgi:arylsulfatase B